MWREYQETPTPDQMKYFWDAVHEIAGAYPVTHGMTAAEKRSWASHYKAYFDALPLVAPTQKLKEALYYASKTRDGRINFEDVNESRSPARALLRKTLTLRDTVNDRLGLPLLKNHAAQIDKFMGSNRQKTSVKEVPLNFAGVTKLADLLKVRDDPVDVYLRKRIPEYDTMRAYQKQDVRSGYVRNAAEYWWKELAQKYEKEPASKQRDLVIAEFTRKFPRTRQMPSEAYKNVKARLPRMH